MRLGAVHHIGGRMPPASFVDRGVPVSSREVSRVFAAACGVKANVHRLMRALSLLKARDIDRVGAPRRIVLQRRTGTHFRDDSNRESKIRLRSVPLDRVARRAQQLQVLVVIGAAPAVRHDVVNGEVPERKRELAAVATTLLLTEEPVLVRPIVRQLP